jgi:DNA-binding beta-propeller fold protein YncE
MASIALVTSLSAENALASICPPDVCPSGIAYEPVNGRMYVANSGSGSVSVIKTPIPCVNPVSQAISLPR